MFFNSISQIDIHYKPASGSYRISEKSFLPGTPKPGYRFPYIEFVYENKNSNSHQILDVTGFTLIALAEELTPELKSIVEQYQLAAVLLKHLPETDNIYKSLGITNTGYYLVRPDMHIALQSQNMDTDQLKWYLNKFVIENQNIELPLESVKSLQLLGDLV